MEIKVHIKANVSIPKVIKINYGIYIDGVLEKIPIGVFNVYSGYIENENIMIMKCSDNMIKLDENDGYYDSGRIIKENGSVTLGELAADICEKKGVELETTSFLNSDLSVYVYDTALKAKELLGFIAECAGCFCCAGRDGKIYFRQIGQDEMAINLNMFKTFKFGEELLISRVAYENGVDSWKFGDDTRNTLWLNQENIYIVDEEEVESIYEELKDLTFCSFTGTVRIDPRIDIGDKIIIGDRAVIYQGELILSNTFLANIKSEIDGKNKEETTIRRTSQKDINRKIQSRIDEQTGKITQLASQTDENSNKLVKHELDLESIEDIVSAIETDMYSEDGVVNENFTKILQTIQRIVNNVQRSGGNNLLKNSVMFAFDDNNIPENWILEGTGTLDIKSSTEAMNNGGLSGHIFILDNKKVRQRINVKADSSDITDDEKTYYTFSTKILKNITGTCYIKIFNTQEEYMIQLNNGESSFYGDYEIKSLLPKENYYDIEFYGSENSNATFTDNMFAIGEYKTQWCQASGEIMNTQVIINENGVLTKSSIYQGDYTVMSPLEFSGYSNINGTITKVFTLNKDTTYVKKLTSEDEIKMDPIKVITVTEGDLQGWAFVPSSLNKEVE